MELWIKALRTQIAQISNGRVVSVPSPLEEAPPEIAMLSSEISALGLAIAERDRVQLALIHEVHHRVKNNLQIVSSLLNMQARKITDPSARDALGRTQARIGALALIHRLLYEQNDNGEGSHIGIGRLITELSAQLRVNYRGRTNIDLACEASARGVPLDHAVPLALLSVEAITNAYAHAFPEGQKGRIDLRFCVTDDIGVLEISDDGVGFDPDGDSRSMGRPLMAAFAHQLGGTLSVASAAGSGTVVSLRYPADANA